MKANGKEAAEDLMALARKSPRAMDRALYKFGNNVMRKAKKITPVEYGTLRDSGEVDHPKREGNTVTLEMGFGGAASEYALFVHEDLEARHEVGEAKFLERPLNEAEATFDEEVGADYEKFMGIG